MHEAPCVCAGNSKQQTASLASSQVPAQLVPQQHPPAALCLGEPHPPATFRHCQRLTAASRSSPRQPTAGPLSTVTGQRPLGTHPAASRPRLKDPSYDPRCIYVPLSEAQVSQGQGPAHHGEMVPLHVFALLVSWEKIFNEKNPTENLEEGYPALK